MFWDVTSLHWTLADLFAMLRHTEDQHCVSRPIFSILGAESSALKSIFSHITILSGTQMSFNSSDLFLPAFPPMLPQSPMESKKTVGVVF